jgi:hypothetical protein
MAHARVSDMNVRALFSFAVFGSFLIGCGSGSLTQAAPAVSPLAGNWLITGPIPSTGIPFSGMGTGLFSLAMSFDVTGDNITASGYASGFCTPESTPPIYNGAFSFGSLTTGVVAADGSFTLQTPQNAPVASLLVQGKVPQMNADQFSGTYMASFNSTIGRPCVGNSSGMFTATSLPLVSGVYTGAGNFQTLTNGVSTATPITMQVSLQQGATVLDPATGLSKPSDIVIGGSIRVQGFPCFTSGTADTTLLPISGEPMSSIAGNTVVVNFAMDDGSTLNLTGSLTDATESHITALFFVVPSAKCGVDSPFFPTTDLTRQD